MSNKLTLVILAAFGIAALSTLSPVYSQERIVSQQEAVDCIRRNGPSLVEGKTGDVRDFVQRPNGDIDFYTEEALRVWKACEILLVRKQDTPTKKK